MSYAGLMPERRDTPPAGAAAHSKPPLDAWPWHVPGQLRVHVEIGDSDLPPAPYSGGSAMATSLSGTIHDAVGNLVRACLDVVADDESSPLGGRSPDEVTSTKGGIYVVDAPSIGETYVDILARHGTTGDNRGPTFRPRLKAVSYSGTPPSETKSRLSSCLSRCRQSTGPKLTATATCADCQPQSCDRCDRAALPVTVVLSVWADSAATTSLEGKTAMSSGSDMTTPDTIVLIHGLWMTPRSWEKWAERYTSRGYHVLAPSWPGMEAEVEALNADSAPIADLTVDDVVDHYEKIIRGLQRPPIIMGHSFGGTFTQILLDRGLGAAGVGVASATVKGVPDLPLSTIKATAPALNPFKKGQAVPLTAKEFHYAFANTMSREDSDVIYQRYHVPAASTVLREGAFANFHRDAPTKVDFHRERAPLLFIAFTEDHIVPPKASRHNEEKYDDSVSITEFIEFSGRPHFPGAPGWEEVADYALRWAVEHACHTPADHRSSRD